MRVTLHSDGVCLTIAASILSNTGFIGSLVPVDALYDIVMIVYSAATLPVIYCKLWRFADDFQHLSSKAAIMTDFLYGPCYIEQHGYMDIDFELELLIDGHDPWVTNTCR